MSSRSIWFVSDTHFNHGNILKFRTKYPDGDLVRPGFLDVQHMNETMIENWNSVVKPNDIVYHLGDVAFGNVTDMENILNRLNGKKRLILGNHDKFDILVYRRHFKKIGSWRSFGEFEKKFVACHYPLHADSFIYRSGGLDGFCVHGHIHEKVVLKEGSDQPDPRYINVCVERRRYTPIHIDDLMKEMKT